MLRKEEEKRKEKVLNKTPGFVENHTPIACLTAMMRDLERELAKKKGV